MKRGQTVLSNINLYFVILLAILVLGLVLGLGAATFKVIGDSVLPSVKSAGETIPQASEGVNIALVPLEVGISSLPWLVGVLYLVSLIGTLGIAFAFRFTGQKYLLVMFFALSLGIIMGSMMIANAYESFHDSGSAIGQELQAQTLLSFLMLYSPLIFTFIMFIGAAILFTGIEEVGTI